MDNQTYFDGKFQYKKSTHYDFPFQVYTAYPILQCKTSKFDMLSEIQISEPPARLNLQNAWYIRIRELSLPLVCYLTD